MFKGLKKISALEVIIFILFFIYIIFDIKTPKFLNNIIDTPLGIVAILILVLILFLYMNPIIGILGIFVAYEIIRRSNTNLISRPAKIDYKPINIQRDFDVQMPAPEETVHASIEEPPMPVVSSEPERELPVEIVMANHTTTQRGVPSGILPTIHTRLPPMSNEYHATPEFNGSLEAEMIQHMMPNSTAHIENNYLESQFKPISEDIHNASVI